LGTVGNEPFSASVLQGKEVLNGEKHQSVSNA
jgi:hypothetical protein